MDYENRNCLIPGQRVFEAPAFLKTTEFEENYLTLPSEARNGFTGLATDYLSFLGTVEDRIGGKGTSLVSRPQKSSPSITGFGSVASFHQ